MGVHGDDIVRTIREALSDKKRGARAPTQSEVRMTPKPDESDGWRYRDGTFEFDVIGSDWFRAFRVTVTALPIDEYRGEPGGSDEWVRTDNDEGPRE